MYPTPEQSRMAAFDALREDFTEWALAEFWPDVDWREKRDRHQDFQSSVWRYRQACRQCRDKIETNGEEHHGNQQRSH